MKHTEDTRAVVEWTKDTNGTFNRRRRAQQQGRRPTPQGQLKGRVRPPPEGSSAEQAADVTTGTEGEAEGRLRRQAVGLGAPHA